MNNVLRKLLKSCALATVIVGLIGCASTPTRESTGEYLDDTTITTKIKTAYATDPVVSAMQVNVETYKGVVQLSGFVNSEEASEKAEQIASNTRGVTKVVNHILIKPVAGEKPPVNPAN